MNPRLFIDSGDIEEIREAMESGIIYGMATNPNKLSMAGITRERIIEQIRRFTDGPIAVQSVSTTAPEIVKEAEYLSGLNKNIAVKIVSSQEGIKAVSQLAPEGIWTNATLIFSASQALAAGLAGSPFISPFVGRARDNGTDGITLLSEIRAIYDSYGIESKVIAASIKDVRQLIESVLAGADMVAIPYKVFKDLFTHPLTQSGLDQFLSDWSKMEQE